MNRAEATARLAKVQLRASVDVEDFTEDSRPRRRYRYSNPDGLGTCSIEIDVEPSSAQLDDLARNLPLPAGTRADARAKLGTPADAGTKTRDL